MKQVLMIVGSLREQSFNRQLAAKAAELINGAVEVKYLNYADLPFMNQDIEFPAPEQVARVRQEVSAADGIWLFTPEYNSSYPGVLKNLLDWLSRPVTPGGVMDDTAISGKKVTISGAAGKSAAAGAREKLVELMGFIRTNVLAESSTGFSLGKESYLSNVLHLSEEQEAALHKQAEAFLNFLEVSPT